MTARVMIWVWVTWTMVPGLSTRTWDSFHGLTGLASARGVLPEEVSGPHTFEMINLIYFSHYTTLLYPVFTIRWLYSLTHSLTHYLLHLLFSCLPSIPYILTAPSELSFYMRSDDVMLPEPSVSRSFLYFPHCSKSRECSGSFFTWLVGWVTDTPHRLSKDCLWLQ
jgi:hypothetical protein